MQIRLTVAAMVGAFVVMPSFAVDGDKTVTSKQYVDSNIAQKQQIISKRANSNTAMTFPTTTGGAPGERKINTAMGTSTSDSGLATTGAINTALNNKQEKITGGTSGDVVLYNQSGGISGDSKGVYNSTGTYTSQSQKLVEAQHVNDAVTSGFNAHLTCANPPDCTLWNVNELSGTYVPQNQ